MTVGAELGVMEREALGPNIGFWLGMLLEMPLGSSVGCSIDVTTVALSLGLVEGIALMNGSKLGNREGELLGLKLGRVLEPPLGP